MDILTKPQLKILSKHKYCMAGQSILERVFLSGFCNELVKLFPRWVAPNVITFVGSLLLFVPGVLVLTYSPSATRQDSEICRCLWAAMAVGSFLYQVLDCVDGKQARRTGTSSPLGEFLDHGFDALATIVMPLSVSAAMALGEVPAIHVFTIVAAITLFQIAHWHNYITGKVHVNELIDVEEARLFSTLAYIVAAVVPSARDFFASSLDLPWCPFPATVRNLAMVPPSFFVFLSLFICVRRCTSLISQKPASEHHRLYGPFIQYFIWVVGVLAVVVSSPLFSTHPQLVLVTLTLPKVHSIHRVLVLNMSRSHIGVFHPLLCVPYLLLANTLTGAVSELPLFTACLALQLMFIAFWSVCAIRQMLDHLNIRLFTIPTP